MSFGSLFAGHIDLEQKGLDGTSVNERCRGVSLRLVRILMPRSVLRNSRGRHPSGVISCPLGERGDDVAAKQADRVHDPRRGQVAHLHEAKDLVQAGPGADPGLAAPGRWTRYLR